MRTVTKKVIEAWKRFESKTVDNTRTDGERIWLHGNCIAKRDNGSIYISTGGWNTLTTRERLNGFLSSLGIPMAVYQHKHDLYYTVNGEKVPWDGSWLMVR